MIYIAMIDRLIFDGSLLGKPYSLDLMPIGEVRMMSGDYFIVIIIGFCSQQLVLCSGLEVVCGFTMIHGGVVVNLMLMFRCHIRSLSFGLLSLTKP
jgi:hypothetical protein